MVQTCGVPLMGRVGVFFITLTMYTTILLYTIIIFVERLKWFITSQKAKKQ